MMRTVHCTSHCIHCMYVTAASHKMGHSCHCCRASQVHTLPHDALVHMVVAWAVGGLMAYLAGETCAWAFTTKNDNYEWTASGCLLVAAGASCLLLLLLARCLQLAVWFESLCSCTASAVGACHFRAPSAH